MSARVDLAADVGEGFGAYQLGDDKSLIPLLTSANVACGFHAGDPRVMQHTVNLCKQAGTSVGAHPGFADLVGFGRRGIELLESEVYTDVLYQVGALDAFARAAALPLAHVAPHGRLGNLVQTRKDYARAVAEAVAAYDPSLIVLSLQGELISEAASLGLKTGVIGIIDRSYEDDGSLTPRNQPGAVLHDPGQVAERAVRLATEGFIMSRTGFPVEIDVDSILLHGDNPAAVSVAKSVRTALTDAGVQLASLPEVIAARTRQRTT